MSTIGEVLRRERVIRGLTYRDAEQALHIRAAYLEALENDNFGAIPGAVYVKGFLRNYGQFLGLDGDALVERYCGESGDTGTLRFRRIALRKVNEAEDEALPNLEDMELHLNYEGRKERRKRMALRERLILGLILCAVILFLIWLFFS